MYDEELFEEEQEETLEESENTGEQPAEENAEGDGDAAEEEKKPKTYTDEELEALVNERAEAIANKRVDEILPSKIERSRAKIRKEYDEEYAAYKEAGEILKVGMKATDVKDAVSRSREYYQSKGIEVPEQSVKSNYSEADLKVLADYEAEQIMKYGFDEVVEEVERLTKKGVSNMTAKEKRVFTKLATHRSKEEERRELLSMGIKEEVVDSSDFKEFASNFKQGTPMKTVYELYEKTQEKEEPPIEKMGSMTNKGKKEEKDFFTPEEVDKLTDKDFDDPKIMEKVRKSMLRWKN